MTIEAIENKLLNTFRAFKNRNYTLFFCGQSVSQIGTWMQRTGVSWVVYSMTHSAFMLGLTVFAGQFPSFALSLFGGVVSDRYNRYKVLLITQTASMVQAGLLALLIFTNHYQVWEILVLSALLAVINAFDVPARQPMVSELVPDKADLANALALNSSMVNLARLIGPALSGIVLLKFGGGMCFLLNAISFLAVLLSLVLMKLPPYVPAPVKKKMSKDLYEGWAYLIDNRSLSVVLLMLTLVSLLVLPYNTLLPIYAKVIFTGNAATFGYINSYIGLGAVIGSFFLAALKKNADLKVVLLANSIIFGLFLALFSHVTNFALAMVFATITGFGMMSQITLAITIVQVDSAKAMQGRLMSFVAMAYFGMLPIGSLLIGVISQQIGAPNTLLCQGITGLIIAAVFAKFLTHDRRNKPGNDELLEAENMALEES